MYKDISSKYEISFSKNAQTVLNIYFDNVLVNPNYITKFKKGGTLFSKEFELGSTPSQYIEIKIHKRANIKIPKKIRIEFGLLVNHALTVYEVNKMLVGELSITPIRSLSSHDENFEMIPIGIYNVDDYNDKDSNLITIKASDNIINLDSNDGYYDITSILKEDTNKNKYATLVEIAEDICKKKGLELGSKSFLNSTKKMYVYDNSITAREYIGYIAECAGGFACAGRDGKIYFRDIGKDTIEISQNLFKTYKYSEQYKISKVAYENGIDSFKFGNETGNTLWLNQDNIFITDKDEVKNIYDKIKDLSIYSFEGTVEIDPRIDIGDIIIVNGKKVIYQGEMTFGGKPRTNIKSNISIKAKSETTVKKPSQKTINRRVQSRIDETEGKIEQLVKETTKSTETIMKTIENNQDEFQEFVDSTFFDTVKNLQNQIDGAILFWNGTTVPTLNNYPASDWKTEEDKIKHTADIYTVISGGKQGKSYRFDKVDGTWKWIELTDNELSAVTELAQQAQNTADKKMRVFIEQPFPPYRIGDLWINNEEIYKCNTDKETGIFASSEWEKATKYTDDTKANEVAAELVTTIERVTNAETTIDGFKDTVASVETQVTTATNIANNANDTASNSANKAQEALNRANGVKNNFDEYKNNNDRTITEIKKSVATTHTDSKYAIEVAESIVENGVTKLDTKTGFTFNNQGLAIEKTGAETKSKWNETGMEIIDSTGSSGKRLLFAGYDKEKGETIVETKNLTVEKYFSIGKNSRIEDYQGGTAIFYTGGGI